MCSICRDYPGDLSLRSEKYLVDPKSPLGILAMMYSARNEMYLDITDLDENLYPKFMADIEGYMVPSEE